MRWALVVVVVGTCWGAPTLDELSISVHGATPIYFEGPPLELTSITATLRGPAILDGGGNTSFFSLTAASLSLETIILRNGATTGSGGCMTLNQDSRVELSNVTVRNCFARGSGGAFALDGWSFLTAVDSIFIGNRAGEWSGVADALKSTLEFTRCQFLGNRADEKAGVAYVNQKSVMTVTESQFLKNTAGESGGVVVVRRSSWTVATSNFTENNVGEIGGVFQAWGDSSINIVASMLRGNYAETKDGGVGQVASGSVLTMSDCTVQENRARSGGVITVTDAHWRAEHCTFHKNRAWLDGGVVRVGQDAAVVGTFDADHCTFNENQAAQHGGVARCTLGGQC